MKAKEILERANNFNMDIVVERYAKDHDLSIEVAKEHEAELKKYLTLCALHPKKKMGMRGQVDELWHTFIFFTKEYQRFCETVAGHFIHHVPNTSRSKPEKSTYLSMLKDYMVEFEEEPPAHIWPIPTKVQESASLDICSTSCNTCGGGGSSCGSGCSACDTCGIN